MDTWLKALSLGPGGWQGARGDADDQDVSVAEAPNPTLGQLPGQGGETGGASGRWPVAVTG